MKVLKIKIDGLDIFENSTFDLDFFAENRVYEDTGLCKLFSNIYSQNLMSIVGINASGKTTTLRLVSFIIKTVLQNRHLNYFNTENPIDIDGLNFTLYYNIEDRVVEISSWIKRNELNSYYFTEEILKERKISSIKSKEDLFNFSNTEPFIKRSDINDSGSDFLSEDVSVNSAYLKKSFGQSNMLGLLVIDYTQLTNINYLDPSIKEIPVELTTFLDSSVEYLKNLSDDKSEAPTYELKFINKEPIYLKNIIEVQRYLSSGTIKGINIFASIYRVLSQGGILIVDELENHFNKAIIQSIFGFFKDNNINKKGATLVFSTHYSELLDEFERKDNIYIARKSSTNTGKIELAKYSNLVKRNDLKKSEVYLSNYVKKTAPNYSDYLCFKKLIIRKLQEYNSYEM